MRISQISAKYNNTFKSSIRTTYKGKDGKHIIKDSYDPDAYYKGNIITSNSTGFFRNDLFYVEYNGENTAKPNIEAILSFFPKNEKVNIYNFACSDGSETYSLMIELIQKLGKKEAERFFPIQASDIDPVIIADSKKQLDADFDDMRKLILNTANKPETYFDSEKLESNRYLLYDYKLKPRKIIKSNVKFSQQNAAEGIGAINTKNNLVLCRNMWPYLSKPELIKLCQALCKPDKSSLLVIGMFDLKGRYSNDVQLKTLLSACGYEPYFHGPQNCDLLWSRTQDLNPSEEELSALIKEKLESR